MELTSELTHLGLLIQSKYQSELHSLMYNSDETAEQESDFSKMPRAK